MLYSQLSSSPSVPSLPEARATIALMNDQPWLHLLVADLDGLVVGTVTLAIVLNLTYSGEPWAQLENMVVHEGYRRLGIGQALIQRCEEITLGEGCYKMQLLSGHPRGNAHQFYSAVGFEPSAVGFRRYF